MLGQEEEPCYGLASWRYTTRPPVACRLCEACLEGWFHEPPEDEDEEADATTGPMSEEDAAERDAHLKWMREEEERKALVRRTQTVVCGLPRPARVDVKRLMENLNLGEDDDMVDVRRPILFKMKRCGKFCISCDLLFQVSVYPRPFRSKQC